jgi:hypothetical protein
MHGIFEVRHSNTESFEKSTAFVTRHMASCGRGEMIAGVIFYFFSSCESAKGAPIGVSFGVLGVIRQF